MKNLEVFFSFLETKISALEEKERKKILDKISGLENQLNNTELIGYKRHIVESNIKVLKDGLERDIYFWKLNIKYKLFNSLSSYISEDDLIEKDIEIREGKKGLEIQCTVTRLGEKYDFLTTCLEAGGWNIQCFHYRYIVVTKLPKVENKLLSNIFKYSEEKERLEYRLATLISILQLQQNITRDELRVRGNPVINSYVNQIEKLESKIGNLMKFTDIC